MKFRKNTGKTLRKRKAPPLQEPQPNDPDIFLKQVEEEIRLGQDLAENPELPDDSDKDDNKQ